MTKVIQQIESNLGCEIDVKELSRLACYSEFHFHRLFRSYVGESVYGYRKRLVLENAVKQLLHSNASITEISFKCGYENQSSFNKAFKQQFSYTPGQIRKQKVFVSAQFRKTETRRSITMKPEIKTIRDIPVIGARETGSYSYAAPKAWGRVMKFAYSSRLMTKEVRSIGISYDDPNVTNPDCIRYDACLDVDADISGEPGLRKMLVPGGRYAVFVHRGAYENFQQTYADIFNQWLPESGQTLCDGKACFEIYLNRDPRKTKPGNLKTEIYIPLE
jgi:AraC family transcriptional regulator